MASTLPYEIINLVSYHLAIRDMATLNGICRHYHNFFSNHLPLTSNSLVPSEWPRLKQFAALKSRQEIFLEARAFLDITVVMSRCLHEKRFDLFTIFWKEVQEKELETPREVVSYPYLLEQAIIARCEDNLILMILQEACLYLDADEIYIFFRYLLGSKEIWTKKYLFDQYLRKYFPLDYPDYFDNLPVPQDRKDYWKLFVPPVTHNDPLLNATIKGEDEILLNISWDSENLKKIVTAIAITGRKDLFSYLHSQLGYWPYYTWLDSLLGGLEFYDLQSWLVRRRPSPILLSYTFI